MKQYLSLLFVFFSLLLFSLLLPNPSSVFAFCEFGSCTDPNEIPNGGCPRNCNFRDANGDCIQEECSVQPPQTGACCAGPVSPPEPPPPPPPPPAGCFSDSDCIDGNPCTVDYCLGNGSPGSLCVHNPSSQGNVCQRDPNT